MARLVKGREAWRYDTLCAYCKGVIGAEQDVYIIGSHVFHRECLEKILSKTPEKFREILNQLPLDTHEELKKLYEEKQKLPPRGTGLERGTARTGEERGRGKPLSDVERAQRHSKSGSSNPVRNEEFEAELEQVVMEAYKRAMSWLREVFPEIRDPCDTLDRPGVAIEFVDLFLRAIAKVGAERGLLKPNTEFYYKIFFPYDTLGMEFYISAVYCKDRHTERERCFVNKDVAGGWKMRRCESDWWIERGVALLKALMYWFKYKVPDDPEEERSNQRNFREQEERILTREERRKLWDLARKIVDEALKEAGHKHPSEMRIDGLGPDYAKFLLSLREKILGLVSKPELVEMRVETYGKGFGDTHIYIGNEYLYTWRPQFETIMSSFWGWVRRVYNLLKTLAEEGLLKEEVLKSE